MIYRKPIFIHKKELEKALIKKRLAIKWGKTLKGGTVSQVYEGTLNEKPVVIKHTEDAIPQDQTELLLSREEHNIDTEVLQKLDNTSIIVPKVYYHFPEITTTIMEDLRAREFRLLQDLIMTKKLPIKSADTIGRQLAKLHQTSRSWKRMKTIETAEESWYERSFELRMMYPNNPEKYQNIRLTFLTDSQWVWPDSHPKNLFVNQYDEVALIDFGRSYIGDFQFVLPNFLAHIVIYSKAGYISHKMAIKYIVDAVAEYREIESINELIFCQYLAMEVLHRAFGRWIQGINKLEQKLSLIKFGLSVFDNGINKISELTKLI